MIISALIHVGKKMNRNFEEELSNREVSSETIVVLKSQDIKNKSVFLSLREEHFASLLPKVKIGEHAILLNWWESLKVISTY